ncbi:MAG: hypothetical protein JKY88_18445 [Pseudomonadales bacterium]|nr:hypothetical protein [Pseudomonadales bacterium]
MDSKVATKAPTIVPTIDLLEAESSPGELKKIDLACRNHGFFLLKHHGMDREIKDMWQYSGDFFALDSTRKNEVLRSESNPLGFYNRELTKRKRDLKEVFDYMLPRSESGDINQWPRDVEGFKDVMVEFFNASSRVAERTLALVYKALAQEQTDLESLSMGDARSSTVRLNYYPLVDPLSKEERDDVVDLGDMALHHHTDPGVLTLLLQDMVGGLQALSREDGWVDVAPEEGTIVVNLGDAMQVWTNDKYRSAVHRVLPIQGQARFSTPYFFNPSRNAILEPLKGLLGSKENPLYQSFTWKEYIQGRIDDNYTDLGEDDIQIEQYKLEAEPP